MRTTKRFTPQVLARFIREKRGTGTYSYYIPWHRVSRGDPASLGRSHLLMWRGRLRELLSDGELHQQHFASMLPDLDDVLEQFELGNEDTTHILLRYGFQSGLSTEEKYPGTIKLAEQLGIRHPRVSEDSDSGLWKPSTDLVLIFQPATGIRHVLAVAAKPKGKLSKRQMQLLSLEREYWLVRGVPWLLITPHEYDREVALTLRRIAPWALGEETSEAQQMIATRIAKDSVGHSITTVLERVTLSLGCMELAQRALWQSVWLGRMPIDLRRGWRPTPLKQVSEAEYWAYNPIAARRSAWT